MPADRFTIVGLARARTAWFSEVARWSASSLVPAEFTKCVSAAEVRTRLDALGAVSAVLLDAGAPGVDRDLIAVARDAGAAVLVVEDGRARRDWIALGASSVLPVAFDPDLLVAQLRATAAPAVDRTAPARPTAGEPTSFVAPLIAVCGVPGAGASTVSMAVAQGLAARADGHGSVLLADFAHDGMLGAYHAAPDVVPGLQEVVEAHRGGRPDRTAVRSATFEVESRGYSVLLGLRRPRDWTALPTRAADAALVSLRSAFRWVVADLTAELDGEPETGSIDLEEREPPRPVERPARRLRARGRHARGARRPRTRAAARCAGRGGRRRRAHRARDQPGAALGVRPGRDHPCGGIAHVRRRPARVVPPPPTAARPGTDPSHGRPAPDPARCRGARRHHRHGRPRRSAHRRRRVRARADPPGGVLMHDDSPVSIIEHAVQDRARLDAVGVDEPDGERRHPRDHRRGDPAVAGRPPARAPSPPPRRSRRRRRPGLPQPRRLRPADPAPRRRRRLGDHDQRARRDLREAAPRRRAATTTRCSTTTTTSSARSPRSSTTRRPSHRKLDPTEGLQDAQLDDGARLHIVHGDVSRGGHVMVNIRKFTGVRFPTLDQLVERRHADAAASRAFLAGVRARPSSRSCSPAHPGSGKTTLLSCCAAELDPSLRVVDRRGGVRGRRPAAERRIDADPRAHDPTGPRVDLRRLVSGFLRMAPDVAIVGEVRDREALPLLLTLSSGVKGFTTIHAGSARQALTRLRFVCQLSDVSADLPVC